jgi:hypothetical protein
LNTEKKFSLDEMTAKNAILEEELLKPYEPIIYAIPQDQWEVMLSLMKNCVDFQPQMAASLTTLATKQDAAKIGTKLQDYTDWTLTQQRKHLVEMQSVMQNFLTEERRKLEQAGKESEQNGRRTASEVRESVDELSDKLRSVWKVALGTVIGSAALSSLLSALVCFLLR